MLTESIRLNLPSRFPMCQGRMRARVAFPDGSI